MTGKVTSLTIAAVLGLGAQTCPTGLTPVIDTVYAPASGAVSRLFQGSVTITASAPISLLGKTYGKIPYVIDVRAGQFFSCIAPNDAAVPRGSYIAKFEHHDATGTAPWQETWSVPTSDTPIKIAQLRTTQPVSAAGPVSAALLSPGPEGYLLSVIGGVARWGVCGGERMDQMTVPMSGLTQTTMAQLGVPCVGDPVSLSQLSQGGAMFGQVLAWNGLAYAPTTPGAAWGGITGTLSAQSDLAVALGLKLAAAADLSDLADKAAARTNLGISTVGNTGAYADLSGKPAIPTVAGGACTNQVVTAISSSAVPTCAPVGSAMVDSSIAKTGADVNTSSQVTVTHLAAPLPVVQGGSGATAPAIVPGAGATVTGSWPNQTVGPSANVRTRGLSFTFDGSGGAIAAGGVKYLTVPFACTISGWNFITDGGGVATVRVWKRASGTMWPTVADVISTTGVSSPLASTAVHSSVVSDFTTTAVAANDMIAVNLYANVFASVVNFVLECDQ